MLNGINVMYIGDQPDEKLKQIAAANGMRWREVLIAVYYTYFVRTIIKSPIKYEWITQLNTAHWAAIE